MIVTLVVLALSGVQISQSADRLAVVFLVDVSDSMGSTAQEEAYDFIRQSLPEMRPDDLAGIVAFGANAQVARSMSAARELGPVRSTPATGNTNLAAAIRLGLALFPEGAARRMVVLSDGQPTIGDTEGAAQLASAADVEISFVQYTRPP
jgi:Mg-chelatase subunit ChlD